MRYELSDYEWAAIKPFLPSKPRANDRRALDGIFWDLRSGAPWRDLPASFGNYLAFIQLASIRLWLRVNQSAP